jgi:SNF2 family DNA or RNA helicase
METNLEIEIEKETNLEKEKDISEVVETRMKLFNEYTDKSSLDKKQYQYDGVKWCVRNEIENVMGIRGGFIADEMGLGKTITMIGVMVANYFKRTLIVLPPVLIDQWYQQIYKTTGHKAFIYHGKNKKGASLETIKAATIVLTSYGAITFNKKKQSGCIIHEIKWSRIVFDEAHHLRNKNTCEFIGAKMLKGNIKWMVSGTPIQNKRSDFYNLCNLIGMPKNLYTDINNSQIIYQSFILKRTKRQVGINIPDYKTENTTIPWNNNNEKFLSENIHLAVGTFNKLERLVALMRARQSCILPKLIEAYLTKNGYNNNNNNLLKDALNSTSKLDRVIETILNNKGNGNGKIVFCHYKQEIDAIELRLKANGFSVAVLDGRIKKNARTEVINGSNDVIILQIQTRCEGLNLQDKYSEIYFVSPNWNPAVEDQAIGRCHRIGQTKEVNVYRFIMEDFVEEGKDINIKTIENYINNVQTGKRSFYF